MRSYKTVVLSTEHLREDTLALLTKNPEKLDFDIFHLPALDGFMFFLDDDFSFLPDDMQICVDYARTQHATWLRFDTQEPISENLPVYRVTEGTEKEFFKEGRTPFPYNLKDAMENRFSNFPICIGISVKWGKRKNHCGLCLMAVNTRSTHIGIHDEFYYTIIDRYGNFRIVKGKDIAINCEEDDLCTF